MTHNTPQCYEAKKKTGRIFEIYIFEIINQEGQKRLIPLLAFLVDDVMKNTACG